MLRAALFPLMMLVGAPEARADITELQLSLRPEFVLVNRHGNLNHGLGLGARAAYGLSDLVAAEASVGCNRLGSIRQGGVEIDRRTGSVFYDATRCTVGPSAALRFGARFVGTLALGLAYRWEHDSTRDFVSANNVLLEHLGTTNHHALVATSRLSFEFRPWDSLAAGLELGGQTAVVGAAPELDLSIALTVSFLMYP